MTYRFKANCIHLLTIALVVGWPARLAIAQSEAGNTRQGGSGKDVLVYDQQR